MRIAIVGYGSGGQAAALLLSRDGHEVTVFERVPDPGPVGAGFLLQPTGLRVLWELGLFNAALQYGARIERLYGCTVGGQPVMDVRYRELDTRMFGLGVQRGTLFHLLDDAWADGRDLYAGHAIVDVDTKRGRLTDDAGHEHGDYDLIVIADGSGSTLRSKVRPALIDRVYPWGAQWCLVAQADWPWRGELRQHYVQAHRMLGMLPVGTRPDDDRPQLSFFWSVPAEQLSLPPDRASAWRVSVADVWPEAATRLNNTMIPDGLAVARYRDVVHRHWHHGRAVLLGDAAHAMSPQLGQGVNMALLDALTLRDSLRRKQPLKDALAAYQHIRRCHIVTYHRWSRWLTPMFQSNSRMLAGARDLFFHPLSRMPLARTQMLRVLTGTRRGLWDTIEIPPAFLDALGEAGNK